MKFSNVSFGKKTENWYAREENGKTTVLAGGKDIWKKSDEFIFRYAEMSGDFCIIVKISSFEKSDLYAKAGIMAREELSSTSPHVFFCAFPDNAKRNKNNGGFEFQYRLQNKKPSFAHYPSDFITEPPVFPVNYPDTYLKLIRSGNKFSSLCSTDGAAWKLYGEFEIILPKKLFLGFAATSHNKKILSKIVYEIK